MEQRRKDVCYVCDRKRILKQLKWTECEICRKTVCRRKCSQVCHICHKMVCNLHNVYCRAYHSIKCLRVVCDNCLTSLEKDQLQRTGVSGYVCNNCKYNGISTNFCSQCGSYLRCQEDRRYCSQGHIFCDLCAEYAVKRHSLLNTDVDICFICYKTKKENISNYCPECPNYVKGRECMTCHNVLCLHSINLCFRGHTYCDHCSKDNLTTISVDGETVTSYKICKFCMK